MATEFELFVYGQDADDATHVSEAVFSEIDRLEQLLSFFIPWSDVAQINRLEIDLTMAVSAEAFACISLAKNMSELTGGAFDLTAGALLENRKPWDRDKTKRVGGVSPEMKQEPICDYRAVLLDPDTMNVGRLAEGIVIDLGGIAKGFALDQLREILDDWVVESALVHAGQSTMLPVGNPPRGNAWPMRLLDPRNEKIVLGTFDISGEAVSASSTQAEPHILDTGSKKAVGGWLGAWAIAPSAAYADALSTAFMVMSHAAIKAFCLAHPDVRSLMVDAGGKVFCIGDWTRRPYKTS